MPMVKVGKMRVPMHQRLVPVRVTMWLARRIVWAMLVLMVFIMLMAFGQM